ARGYLAFDFKERYFVSEDFILDERKLQKGDLLINSTGVGTAGRVTLFELEGNFVADSHITIFRTNEKVLPKFALYSLANIGFKTIEKMANGSSGQIELTLKTIGNIAFLVPDIATQEQIVSEVSEIEEKIAELQVIMEGSQERKKEILNQYLL
ncbi:restriction endonuclease subunit S, partial [Avibacterium paragallinarum]